MHRFEGRNCIDPGYVNGEGGGEGIKKGNGGEIKFGRKRMKKQISEKKYKIFQKSLCSQSLEMIKYKDILT